MHMAVNPSITSGLAIGCNDSRSCSRASASPSWPYSRTRVASSVHSRSACRPESTGSRAAGHGRGDEDDRGEDEHGRRAGDLVEDHAGHRHDEAGQRAEQRQPRVERGVAGLLPGLLVRLVSAAISGTSAPLVTR